MRIFQVQRARECRGDGSFRPRHGEVEFGLAGIERGMCSFQKQADLFFHRTAVQADHDSRARKLHCRQLFRSCISGRGQNFPASAGCGGSAGARPGKPPFHGEGPGPIQYSGWNSLVLRRRSG